MKLKSISKRILGLFLAYIVLSTGFVYGQENVVITLGEDLTGEQREEMLNLFGVSQEEVKVLTVTNEEERNYLSGLADEKQIGTKAISSSYVESLGAGMGITVRTYNISWVTKEMYENALVTAGVEDARVVAAAPYNVSGTAALTGILKAFEEATGEKINEEQKKIANEEMVKTGKLGEEIGTERAVQFIQQVKQEVIERKVKEPEEIRKIVIEIAGRLNININEKQIEDITILMQRIIKLNISPETIRQQIGEMGEQVRDISREGTQVQSILERIADMIRRIIESILGMLVNR
jgi:uncharacterized protein YpuA (DUF1002 family)